MRSKKENEMDFEKIIGEFLGALVDERFDDQVEDVTKQELRMELRHSFEKLFNLRLINSFSDEDFSEVEKIVSDGRVEDVPKFAQQKGISLYDTMRGAMIEFAERYRKSYQSVEGDEAA